MEGESPIAGDSEVPPEFFLTVPEIPPEDPLITASLGDGIFFGDSDTNSNPSISAPTEDLSRPPREGGSLHRQNKVGKAPLRTDDIIVIPATEAKTLTLEKMTTQINETVVQITILKFREKELNPTLQTYFHCATSPKCLPLHISDSYALKSKKVNLGALCFDANIQFCNICG